MDGKEHASAKGMGLNGYASEHNVDMPQVACIASCIHADRGRYIDSSLV
jgi:DNA-binding IclR family transcriptional regulator